LESRKSDPQKFRAGQTRLEEKQVAYEFSIRNATAVPRDATVAWKVYREGMSGRLTMVDSDAKAGRLDPGKTVKLSTNPVQVDEREIRAPRVSGNLEEALAGYALTITDKEGKVLLQKFSSREIETAFTSASAEPKRPGAGKVQPGKVLPGKKRPKLPRSRR